MISCLVSHVTVTLKVDFAENKKPIGHIHLFFKATKYS